MDDSLNNNASVMTMPPMVNESFDIEGHGRDYQSQKHLVESSMDNKSSHLNHSTSLGRILFTKEELIA